MTDPIPNVIEDTVHRVLGVVVRSGRTRPYALTAVTDRNHPSGFGLGIADCNERGYTPVSVSLLRHVPSDAGYDAMADIADKVNAALGRDQADAFRIIASTMGGRYYDANGAEG